MHFSEMFFCDDVYGYCVSMNIEWVEAIATNPSFTKCDTQCGHETCLSNITQKVLKKSAVKRLWTILCIIIFCFIIVCVAVAEDATAEIQADIQPFIMLHWMVICKYNLIYWPNE